MKKKNEAGPLPHHIYKKDLKRTTDLNIIAKSIKHLEKNTNFGVRNVFLGLMLKAQATKKK